MSVKNRCERTAKRGWIPLVFGLVAAISGAAQGSSGDFGRLQAVTPSAAASQSQDQIWYDLMDWLIDRLIEQLNCGSPGIPDDVPVAMLMVVDCYATGGLAEMTSEEAAEFVATIDEAQRLTKEAPESVSPETQEKFLSALRSMRAEAVVKQ